LIDADLHDLLLISMTEKTHSSTELKVHICRSEGAAPNLFFIPFERPILVLDLLHWIQGNGDATLAFSYSCRSARCGTCSVLVNRRPVLACQELINDCHSEVNIEPLKGLPIIRDLIVDMQPFLSHWRKVKPFLGSDTTEQDDPALIPWQSPERRVINAARGCIKCGICHSSCGMSGNDRSFLGPAALNHAVALIADSRDRAAKARLSSVLSDGGVDGCHYHGSCSRVCPRSLDPAAAITRLRRWRLSSSP
jgi:succinate dehydrogenase/fumarate reductase iron-sulfur protein